MHPRIRISVIVAAVLSCAPGDHVTEPPANAPVAPHGISHGLVPGGGTCSDTCVLFNTTGPLWSAIANPDSTDAPVMIAAIRYAPVPGDSVTLQLTADAAVLHGIDPNEIVAISGGNDAVYVPLHDLTIPTTVWKFASIDTLTLQVTLNRALAAGVVGQVSLIASSAAAVAAVSRPWFAAVDSLTDAQPSAMRGTVAVARPVLADATPGCGTQGASIFQDGTYCGVNVHFFQAVPADAFLAAGATFQSDLGHGVSHEITITFSPPVANVAVTAYDPTFAGNRMVAYDSTGGLIGTVPFPGNNTPGTLTTRTGTLSGAISSMHLIPAPLDYVAYSMRVVFAPSTPLGLTMSSQGTGILEPTWNAYRDAHCLIDARSSNRTFTLRVFQLDPAGSEFLGGRTIAVAVAVIPYSGSHMHDNGARPTGSLSAGVQSSTATVVTDTSGAARVTFYPPEVSGVYVLTASTPGAGPAVDTLAVGYDLPHLPISSSYVFTGELGIHPDAYYATAQMATALQMLADSMQAHGLPLLGVNDESLSLGGLFDLDANWMPPNHCSHRDGVAADIESKNLSPAQDELVKRVWRHVPHGAGYYFEVNHLHLKVLR